MQPLNFEYLRSNGQKRFNPSLISQNSSAKNSTLPTLPSPSHHLKPSTINKQVNFQSLILYLNKNNARCSHDQMGKYNGNALERFKPDFFRFFLTAAVFACKVYDFPFCATMRKFRKKYKPNGRSDVKHL